MFVFDAHGLFSYSRVMNSPGTAGLSITVSAGSGVAFPTAPFNCCVWPSTVPNPTLATAEIVRVTAGPPGDIFTIERAQEGSHAQNIRSGYQIANAITPKVLTDIENAINSGDVAGNAKASTTAVTTGLSSLAVTFSGPAFTSTPVVTCNLVPTGAGDLINVVPQGATTAGFTANWGFPIPAGYYLSWVAAPATQ